MNIHVVNDFEGYFESLVDQNINLMMNPNITDIYITAGPYRPYGCAYEFITKSQVHIDFYSGLRVGFGESGIVELMSSLNIAEYNPSEESAPVFGKNQVLDYIEYHQNEQV